MKEKKHILTLALCGLISAATAPLHAQSGEHSGDADHGHKHHNHEAQSHDHGHALGETKKKPGPNGGRMVTVVSPAFEFLARPGKSVEIRFIDESGKIVPPSGQEVELIGGNRSDPIRLRFKESQKKLVSDKPLPKGNRYPVILNIRTSPDDDLVRERFNLNFATCPACKLSEYACTCDHAE